MAGRRQSSAANLGKAFLLLAGFCALFGGLGWLVGEYRLLLLFGAIAVLSYCSVLSG